jgi:hypothetical protein
MLFFSFFAYIANITYLSFESRGCMENTKIRCQALQSIISRTAGHGLRHSVKEQTAVRCREAALSS